MNLLKKKKLAAKVLGVGVSRIKFDTGRLDEIKEAITSQDMRDLIRSKAIEIKEAGGRKKKRKRKTKKGPGKIKKKVKRRKQEYVKLTRKLRAYIKKLGEKDKISQEDYKKLREKIRASTFRSKAHLEEHLKESKIIKKKKQKDEKNK